VRNSHYGEYNCRLSLEQSDFESSDRESDFVSDVLWAGERLFALVERKLSFGVSAVDSDARTIWIADADRDGNRYDETGVVRAKGFQRLDSGEAGASSQA